MNDAILREISDFCRETGLAESTFGRRAVNDGKLTTRLRNGGRITTDTLDRLRAFISTKRAPARCPPPGSDGPPHAGRTAHGHRATGGACARASACALAETAAALACASQRGRPAAQFPLLRQPAEISPVRQKLQREVGHRQSR